MIKSVYESLKPNDEELDIVIDQDETALKMEEFELDASEYGSF